MLVVAGGVWREAGKTIVLARFLTATSAEGNGVGLVWFAFFYTYSFYVPVLPVGPLSIFKF